MNQVKLSIRSLSMHLLLTIFTLLISLAGMHVAAESNLLKQAAGQFSGAVEEPDFLHVDEAYIYSSSVAGNQLVIHWEIADGYYLYKDRMQVKSLTPGTVHGDPVYSKPGVEKQDEYFGLVQVFYDDVEMRIPIEAMQQGEAEFTIVYQGCAEAGLCYPPQKRPAIFIGGSTDASGQVGVNGVNNLESQNTGLNKVVSTVDSAMVSQPANADLSFIAAVLFAFFGGIILNLMPCVFPVLSLKALKLAKASGMDGRQHRLQALSYTAGVLSLFVAVAGLLLVLRSGGESIGWGFQLQSPWFVAAMVYLLFALGLTLLGWLELGTRLMGIGDGLTQQDGNRGAFFTGALAVVVASPCTAPFMGSALGYAITQPPIEALAVFVALGLGMAVPFLIIGFVPKVAGWLPKPGAWMDTMRQILAFPMFLSALWLLWVLGRQTGVEGMTWVLLGLLLMTFAVWLRRHSRTRGTAMRNLGLVGSVSGWILAALIIVQQPWQPVGSAGAEETNTAAFSEDYLAKAISSGKTVFVNITADWCVSCLVNEKTVLSTEPVYSVLHSDDVEYIKGDWTNADANITDYLASFGRNGVPMYVVYQQGQAPKLLPQILTSSTVMEALESSPQVN